MNDNEFMAIWEDEKQPTVASPIEPVVMLPCPFCGGEPEIDCDSTCDISWSIDNAQVICSKCEASADVVWCDKLDKDSCEEALIEARKLWNTRAT